MSDTRFFYITKFADGWDVFLADDSYDVIAATQEIFKESDVKELDMNEFSRLLSSVEDQKYKLAILDGTFIKGEGNKTSSLDSWLEKRRLISNNSLFLIGYSGDLVNKTSKCIRWYVKGTDIHSDVKELERLCRETTGNRLEVANWPLELSQVVDNLSRIIHRTQNILLPITLDAETLAELANKTGKSNATALENKKAIEEIFLDHFGSGHSGYLGESSDQHSGTDIIGQILALCGKFPADLLTETQEKEIMMVRTEFEKAVGIARSWAKDHIPARIDDSFMRALREQLTQIVTAGEKIVTIIRDIRRDKLQAKI